MFCSSGSIGIDHTTETNITFRDSHITTQSMPLTVRVESDLPS